MVKVGDKFIIEVKEQVEPKLLGTGLVACDGGAICFFEDTLKQCERYNETEAYKKGYAKAMEDIQEAVRMLLAMDYNDRDLHFGGSHITAEILSEFDVREIVERLEAYKKEQSEIRVGDEVEINDSNVIVTYVRGSKMYVLYGDGSTEEVTVNHTEIRKTGRHFDEVEKLIEILKNMTGGEDSEQIPF